MEKPAAISKEQWQEIENTLSRSYGIVNLICDGFPLTLEVQRIAPLKYGIFFFVEGIFLGKWLLNDCEERRRFCRPVEGFVFDAKLRNSLINIYGGKRAPKAKVEEINRKFTAYQCAWTNAKALCRHLRKNNLNIQLGKIEY
jgi:hypothetical protein